MDRGRGGARRRRVRLGRPRRARRRERRRLRAVRPGDLLPERGHDGAAAVRGGHVEQRDLSLIHI